MGNPKKIRRIRLVYLLSLLVSVAVAGTTLIQIFAAYKAEKASLYETTLQLNHESAQKLSFTADNLFRSMLQSLQYGAEFIAAQQYTGETLQKHLDLLQKSNNYFNSLFVANKEGTVQAMAPASLSLAGQTLTSEASKNAIAVQRPTISSPFYGATNRLVLLVTYPLFAKSGEYMGYVAGSIYLEERNIINDIFGSDLYAESGSYFFVVDSSGKLIFHPDKSRIGENVAANRAVAKVIQGVHGSERVVNTRGIPFLAGYASSSVSGWGIVAQTPEAEIKAKSVHLIKNGLSYSLPVFVMIVMLTFWLARKLAAPFSALAETARDLSDGKSVPALPKQAHWNYEAYYLSETVLLAINSLQKQADRLSVEAQTDALTGLYNRRTMDMCISEWIERNAPFSVIAIDIDHFKNVNDTYGHPVGDEVIRFLAQAVLSTARKDDICCRIGGEEFVILLPNVPGEAAYKAAERLREHMAAANSPTGKPITISLGVAEFPGTAATAKDVLGSADQALYSAKRGGRNRTVRSTADNV